MKCKQELKFSSLVSLAVGAIDPAKPPTRIKFLNWGDNPSTKGIFKVGDKTLATLSASQKKYGYDTVVLDYEHNTFPGTAAYKETKEPRDVAAHGTVEVVPNDGVYLNISRWTPEGPAKMPNYYDVSGVVSVDPVINADENGEVAFIHSVALCRQGAVHDMHLESLSVEFEGDADADDATLTLFRKALAKLLNLAPDATDEAIAAAINGSGLVSLSADIGALKTSVQSVLSVPSLVQSLETRLTALSNDWNKKFEDRERALISEAAAREGKLIPLSADQLAATPVQTLRDMVAKLQPTVPITRLTPLSVQDTKPAATEDTAARREKANKIFDQHKGTRPYAQCWEDAAK